MKKLLLALCWLLFGSVAVASEELSEIDDEQERFVYDRLFPIWGQEAYDRGHELPKPYGLTVNYMTMDQPLEVTGVNVTGLNFCGPFNCPDLDLSDSISKARQDSETLTLRGDMWVLPFLNVYGVLGHTRGSSVAPITVNNTHVADFNLKFKGMTYGAGTTIAGGIGNWFALVDANYTYTDLDILDGKILTFVAAPRVGYRFKINNHDVQLWGGMMYQDVQQSFSGNIRDIGINLDGSFEVEQRLTNKWNTITGGQVGVTDNIDLLIEAGFGERRSLMLGLGYRF